MDIMSHWILNINLHIYNKYIYIYNIYMTINEMHFSGTDQ